ncbi:hypothetical protein L195_g043126, partial [Trifolium pratense]
DQFCRHFTASRKHPKTVLALEAIYQAEEESLRNFIERFNKEVVHVDTTDDMKKYLLQRGLRSNSDFATAAGIEKPPTWDDLLVKAQAYIQYEEVQAADVARLARPGSSHPARESSYRSDDRGDDRGGHRGGDRGEIGGGSTGENLVALRARSTLTISRRNKPRIMLNSCDVNIYVVIY